MSGLLLNLGSGQRPFSSPWTNVDCQSKWNPDRLADFRSMPHIPSGSADMIIMHHTIEHLWSGDNHPAFQEAYRILSDGGSLLIFVPDMRELARRWLRGEMNDQLYFTNVYGAYMGDEADRHKWGFTGTSLSETLMGAAPWKTVKSFDWRSIPGADIARDFWILGVEAIK